MSRAGPQPSDTAPGEALERLVPLAVVTGAHGVQGELRVRLHNPSSALLASLPAVLVRRQGQPGEATRVAVRSARPMHEGMWRVALAGCADRDAAAAFRGAELCVSRQELPPLGEGEHYLVDLQGLRAVLPDGQPLGVVERAIEYPAAQVLSVRMHDGALVEVPLREPYVREISVEAGSVIVDHVEDLEVIGRREPERS